MSKFITHLTQFASNILAPLSRLVPDRSKAPAAVSKRFTAENLFPTPARMEIAQGMHRHPDRQLQGWNAAFAQMPQRFIARLNDCGQSYNEAKEASGLVASAEYMSRTINEMPIPESRVAMRMMLCGNSFGDDGRGKPMHLACARGILEDVQHMSSPTAIANAAIFASCVGKTYGVNDVFEAGQKIYEAVKPLAPQSGYVATMSPEA